MDQYSSQPNNQYPYGNGSQPNPEQPYPGYGSSNYQQYGYGQQQYVSSSDPLLSTPTGVYQLVGFWPRVGAALIDFCALLVFAFIATLIFRNSSNYASWIIGAVYSIAFVSYKAATPGKMALGAKIVRADGTPPTFLTALGRYFSALLFQFVGGIILGFGLLFGIGAALVSAGSYFGKGSYNNPISASAWIVFFAAMIIGCAVVLLDVLWVVWDPRKQALHDKMAGTFVVKTRQ